ncbi:MAG: hypothetical protein OEV49_08435 [candidate division Zixibacteria bacterium]|nr:hypothetical protein [candidate division Zixibacteria bacterium]MDH3937291.1 hypothetical protein [candidate division Zixibacteria bacterium]MDH4035814.1 hypothetical protein [candidate division Zixibacteria bacterium]
MKQRPEFPRFRLAVIAPVLLLLFLGCASRYRLDLYLTVEEDRRHIQVESTQYVWGAVLGNPYGDNKLDEGNGHVAVVTIGTRQSKGKKSSWHGFSSDEYMRCQFYMQVPSKADPDSTVLAGNTLVHLLGRYELSTEERVFLPKEGFYLLDSIADQSLYFSVDGTFANKGGEQLKFDGKVRVDKQ